MMTLGMLMIFVPDLEEAKRFYGEVLGFALRREAGDSLLFSVGGALLAAFRCEGNGSVGDYAREARSVFVFEVPSLDEAFGALRAKGVTFLHDRPAENALGRYVAFADPFGVVHELFEPREGREGEAARHRGGIVP